MNLDEFKYSKGKKFNYKEFDTEAKALNLNKEIIQAASVLNLQEMGKLQDKFYAYGKESLLLIFQAMDAGGKDGAVKHVMSGVNPQGVQVNNFKQPSKEEMAHDYLWRCIKKLPEKGIIGIFNRSYYEDVLITKVHSLYKDFNLPERCKKDIIEKRYKHIENFEKYLTENGTHVLKFFFCISKDEQKRRFKKRIDNKNKNWKLSESDIKERALWDDYMRAYEDAINKTSSSYAPWYVIPADKKWFARFFVSEIILKTMRAINPQYPKTNKDTEKLIQSCKKILENEKN
ncbi:MAG: polyphosphate kinase 2 family protein [Clostridia bacterium]|nr:polyphosphate kinase 2 family protein [Clostridia bacterium]